MAAPKQPWRTVPYISPSGSSDVLDYLEKLKAKNLKQWKRFELIREQILLRGPFLVGPPLWEGVGGSLYEIRWSHHRIYCAVEDPKRVMMLLSVWKIWPKFRNRDRSVCDYRHSEMLGSTYDEEQRGLLYKAHCQRRGKNGSV